FQGDTMPQTATKTTIDVASSGSDVQSLYLKKEIEVDAPIELVWQATLDELGPHCQPGDKPMPMTLEAWPGGRWFRDLGNNTGNFWGHVQVIKPPTLIE